MKKLHQFQNRQTRAEYIEESTSVNLNSVKKSFVDDYQLQKVHCENLIGAVSVPVGLAGPIKINLIQDLEEKEIFDKNVFYIPQATTEGALVASVSRGSKAINLAGGVNVLVEKVGTTRAPILATENLADSFKLKIWFQENLDLIK